MLRCCWRAPLGIGRARTGGADPIGCCSAQLAFIALPYVLTVTHFAMWWGGYSSPARFLVPLAAVAGDPRLRRPGRPPGARLRHACWPASLVVTASLSVPADGRRPRPPGLLRSRQRLCAVGGVGEPDRRSRARPAGLLRARPAAAARGSCSSRDRGVGCAALAAACGVVVTARRARPDRGGTRGAPRRPRSPRRAAALAMIALGRVVWQHRRRWTGVCPAPRR